LATKQTEIQTIKGDQGPKGEQGDRGFDGAPGLDGRDGKNGTDGADGKDGVSVIKAEIVFDGSLVLYLSNGDQIDCGEVTPAKSKEVFQTIKNSGGSSPIDIFTSLLPGLVPASGGGTVNFLRADGTFAAPPGGAPASPTTSVQFNNAGAFGGSANFTYNSGTDTLSVGKLVSANFTSAAQGLVPASGGGTANFLRADGNFAAPPATAPAGATTQIQFNNAGVFGASANFTYVTGTNTFTVGPAGATTTIETLAPTGATVAGSLRLRGKNASATNGAGGGITYVGGSALGTGTGGGHSFSCGSGRIGGGISFISANGTFDGGSMSFNSGESSAGGTGGNFSMNAGLGATTASGGSFEITAGNAASSGNGGGFTMSSGFSLGSGAGGDFTFTALSGGAANGNMYFNTDYGTVIQLTSSLLGDQQLGFYGVTPVAQPTTATTAATRVAVVGTTANIGDTYDGYTLAKVVKALRNLGILA
jgi:hypothetical protein